MSDEELARRVKAREYLEGKGYNRETCPTCKGTGVINSFTLGYLCLQCQGKGYTWKAPLT